MKRMIGLAILLLMATSAYAGTVLVTWDASVSPEVMGYRVHYGTAPGAYAVTVDVGNTTSASIGNLGPGTYYFAATAYDSNGISSEFSNECSKTIDPEPDTEAPQVSVSAYRNGNSLIINTAATDNVGVMAVQVRVNNVQICSFTSAPYTCTWRIPRPKPGSVQVQSVAQDAAGNVGLSAVLTVYL